MKKSILAFALGLVATGAFAAQPLQTRTETVADFTEVHASAGVRVLYTQGPLTPAVIQAPADILPYISVKVSGGKLTATIDHLDNKVRNRKLDGLKIQISSPRIEDLDASSGAVLEAVTDIKSNELDVEASSGALIKVPNASVGEMTVDVSSGALVEIASATTNDFEVDASSGASVQVGTLNTKKAEFEVSSAGIVKLAGTTNSMKIEASSGAVFNGSKFKAKNAVVKTSSGAQVDISAVTASIDSPKFGGGQVKNHN